MTASLTGRVCVAPLPNGWPALHLLSVMLAASRRSAFHPLCGIALIFIVAGLRVVLDREVRPEQHSHPDFVRFATMVAPGVLMTPVSSILEACNAGHANSEPLLRRSTRGILPRCGREILFGVGLNQLSDYFEERARSVMPSPVAANLAGSLTAGVIAGYLSHVPHNLSTYKLMEPSKSYAQLFRKFVDSSVREAAVPAFLSGRGRAAARVGLAVLFPRGVVIRTAQIVGSFAILNGIINGVQAAEQKRISTAMRDAASSEVGGEGREGVTPARAPQTAGLGQE